MSVIDSHTVRVGVSLRITDNKVDLVFFFGGLTCVELTVGATVVGFHGTLFCSVDALAVVNRTNVWFISWAIVFVAISVWFQNIALDFLVEVTHASVLVPCFESSTSPLINVTLACKWISLTLTRLCIISVFRMHVGAGQTVRTRARVSVIISAY